MDRAYVLLSGGLDSTTALKVAIDKYGANNVMAVTMDYGQRHTVEIIHAQTIVHRLCCKHQILDISGMIGKGGLTDPELDMPQMSYAELPEGISPTYVPFRNGLFLSILASIAQADPAAVAIYYGAHSEDAENDAYPDCSEEFINTMTDAIFIGTYQQISLVAPFKKKTKADIVELGFEIDAPLELTWSCYEGQSIHCGTCPTCISRKDAFETAGHADPTEYAA